MLRRLPSQALCEMFTVAGKKLEETSRSPARVEGYLKAMDNMSKSDAIAPRIRFLIRDVLDLRRMKWVPRRETLKVGLSALIGTS
jgi:translation initiation factor 4G